MVFDKGSATARRRGEPRVVVLGGGYAGLTAAAQLAAQDLPAEITVIDRKPAFEQRIRYHEAAAGGEPESFAYEAFLGSRGVAFLQGTAQELDPARQRLTVTAPGGSKIVPYDFLVYALGSGTVSSMVPGIPELAHTLDTAAAAKRANERLRSAAGGRVLVVGGGLTGIEAACEIAERGAHVSVTLVSDLPFAPVDGPGGLSPQGIAHLKEAFSRLGISLVEGRRIIGLIEGAARLEDGGSLPFDLCLWACGFAPPGLARAAGLDVNAIGQIVTDPALRSLSHPNIVAIGDAAEVFAPPGGRCRMSCAAGRPMGTAAARVVASLVSEREPEPFLFGYIHRCISLGREDGLIQFVDAYDAPLPLVWTGARAARWKEYVCRRTVAGIGLVPDLDPPDELPEAIRKLSHELYRTGAPSAPPHATPL